MSTLIEEKKIELIPHVLPVSEIENFSPKILEIQVENHFTMKGLEDTEHTELFLFTPKEILQLAEKGLCVIVTKKENSFYTQELAGFAVAVPKTVPVKNPIMKKILNKVEQGEEEEVFIVDAFLDKSGGIKNVKTMLKMVGKLEKQIRVGVSNNKTAVVYCPIYSANKHFKKIIEIFNLTFEYGPDQTISTEVGVIHLPYKLLTRDQK